MLRAASIEWMAVCWIRRVRIECGEEDRRMIHDKYSKARCASGKNNMTYWLGRQVYSRYTSWLIHSHPSDCSPLEGSTHLRPCPTC